MPQPNEPPSPAHDDDLLIRSCIHYVSGAEAVALRAAQGRALRALIDALAAERPDPE